MSYEFKGDTTKGHTIKSVKFTKLFDSTEEIKLAKKSVITVDGVRMYVASITGVEMGNRMIKVTGKATPII